MTSTQHFAPIDRRFAPWSKSNLSVTGSPGLLPLAGETSAMRAMSADARVAVVDVLMAAALLVLSVHSGGWWWLVAAGWVWLAQRQTRLARRARPAPVDSAELPLP